MQVIGGEGAAVFLQFVAEGPPGFLSWMHAALVRQATAFAHIATATGGDDIFPYRAAAFGARNDMIEGQVGCRFAVAAILAAETVAQENIEPGKSRIARGCDIFFQRNDAGQFHLKAW